MYPKLADQGSIHRQRGFKMTGYGQYQVGSRIGFGQSEQNLTAFELYALVESAHNETIVLLADSGAYDYAISNLCYTTNAFQPAGKRPHESIYRVNVTPTGAGR
jgi:hypothetical protein